MLLRKDFVFIHVQKTGGYFARKVLNKVTGKKPQEVRVRHASILLPIRQAWWAARKNLHCLFPQWVPGAVSFHANCAYIPSEHRHKLVLATKRDPLAYHVSCYRYPAKDNVGAFSWRRWYGRVACKGKDKIDTREEGVPEFGEFVRFFNEELPRIHFSHLFNFLRRKHCHLPSSIGFMSYIYIWYFFKEPEKVLSKTDAELTEYFQSQRYKQDMHQVHFLRTEHLNSDLHDFLLNRGFGRDALRFILTQEITNVSVAADPEAYFTPALADYVKEKNRIYYRYFWRDGNAEPPRSSR